MDHKSGTEAQKYVWEGAIPLQIHLHDSEVTTLPPPHPLMILAPRIGYLPLLTPQIKPFVSGTLPPGTDTVWFEYNGLPLKWYIPTGVLFDLLCAEPERPWNLTVHFRQYPCNLLTPCEDEDAVKWSFISSLKEAAYIINGNCKNVMNMSQSDQLVLWNSVLNGNLDSFLKVTSKLKLGSIEDEYTAKLYPSFKPWPSDNTDNPGVSKTGRIPVRLYARIFPEVFDDLEEAPAVDSWEKVSYINRPIDVSKFKGESFTLSDAMTALLPEYFGEKPVSSKENTVETQKVAEAVTVQDESNFRCRDFKVKLIRIQGIEPQPDIPFSWVVNNLINPDQYLHICVYLVHFQSASL